MKLKTTIPRDLFLLLVALFVMSMPPAVYGQFTFGGSIDAELRKGGSDSAPYVNQTPTDNWAAYTPYIRLFTDFSVSRDLFLQAGLQADYYNSDQINTPVLSLLNVNYFPFEKSNFLVTVGRFVTPYGLYSERLLSSENPFVHLPLSYTYTLPVSRKEGLFDFTGSAAADPEFGTALIYRRGYSQGLMASSVVGEDRPLTYSLAATFSSVSGYNTLNFSDVPSFTGRVTFQPLSWGRIGVSGSYGSYMKRYSSNEGLSDSELSSYKQVLIGTDLTFSYLYFTVTSALNWNRWETPVIDEITKNVISSTDVDAFHALFEGKIRLPFLVGGYIAGRYEVLNPDLPEGGVGSVNPSSWGQRLTRIETVSGYQVTPAVTVKLSYSHPVNDGSDWEDDVWALQVSAGF